MNDSELIAFKAISAFVIDIGDTFGNKQKSLALYKRLIEKTTIVHAGPVKKHVEVFRDFCVKNREALLSRDKTKLAQKIISYTENRVFINLEHLFKFSDKEQTDIIWQHLLTISALLDPAAKAKEVLKKDMENKMKDGKSGNEEKFLTDIIDKVDGHVNPNANPMEAISSIMNSGIFTDLIGSMNSGVNNGSLDIGKLMGTVQNMMSQMGDLTGVSDDPMMNSMNSMMGSMMNNVMSTPTAASVEEVKDDDTEKD